MTSELSRKLGGLGTLLALLPLTLSAAFAAQPTFQFRVSAVGVTGAPAAPAVPVAPARVYAQWDPAATGTNFSIAGLSAQQVGFTADGGNARASVGASSGKWYWEIARGISTQDTVVGIVSGTVMTKTGYPWGYTGDTSQHIVSRGVTSALGGTGANFVAAMSDVIGYALDMDTGVLTLYENCQPGAYAIRSGLLGRTWYPYLGSSGGQIPIFTANFGATPFQCTPPAGYNAGLWQH